MSEGSARQPKQAPSGGIPPERDLVARAQAGDPEAFRMLFESTAPRVRRFLGDVLRDGAAADEATQETFVRAHARLATLRDGEALLGFLFGIARLVSLEQLRLRRRDGNAGGAVADAAGVSDSGPQRDERIDRAPTPEGALLTREADAMLATALAELSGDRRAVLLLRLDHDLGYGDIAGAMGWTLQKVKNEIHRARLQLRGRLAAYLEEA